VVEVEEGEEGVETPRPAGRAETALLLYFLQLLFKVCQIVQHAYQHLLSLPGKARPSSGGLVDGNDFAGDLELSAQPDYPYSLAFTNAGGDIGLGDYVHWWLPPDDRTPGGADGVAAGRIGDE